MTQPLTATRPIEIRFSEVDSMNIVWHGSYPLYFEDAREEFGRKYGLEYMTIFSQGFYAPLVEMTFKFKSPLVYESKPVIEITYIPSEAAKILFDYRIFDPVSGTVYATGHSVQVFLDRDYKLVWDTPEFYRKWKQRWGVSER
ncbi:MAG: acyl-CoA thioesterase [Candidatus Amulumruptor caecigallinarius]|nr:acyl-CoA thioesterase [Candidatus Amulumruptor caecigallinarius]MCM1396347.1 acyl-CoA thioesterase [Candidatus Amulumruptor caecigallinarius]MCM1453711.1 acyl-CoA thioesterase [bacterium]